MGGKSKKKRAKGKASSTAAVVQVQPSGTEMLSLHKNSSDVIENNEHTTTDQTEVMNLKSEEVNKVIGQSSPPSTEAATTPEQATPPRHITLPPANTTETQVQGSVDSIQHVTPPRREGLGHIANYQSSSTSSAPLVECFDVSTPDASTLHHIISVVGAEESINSPLHPHPPFQQQPHGNEVSGDVGGFSTTQSQSSFSIITESVSLGSITSLGSNTSMASWEEITTSEAHEHTEQLPSLQHPCPAIIEEPPMMTTTEELDEATSVADTPSLDASIATSSVLESSDASHTQKVSLSLSELAGSAISFVMVFVILQLQLFLVTRFPEDISTASRGGRQRIGRPVKTPTPSKTVKSSKSPTSPSNHKTTQIPSPTSDTHHTDAQSMNSVTEELAVLYRLFTSICANRVLESSLASVLAMVPRAAVKFWLCIFFCVLHFCLWPCRVAYQLLLHLLSPSVASAATAAGATGIRGRRSMKHNRLSGVNSDLLVHTGHKKVSSVVL